MEHKVIMQCSGHYCGRRCESAPMPAISMHSPIAGTVQQRAVNAVIELIVNKHCVAWYGTRTIALRTLRLIYDFISGWVECTLCLNKKFTPFYFCDKFTNCKPIQIIFSRNMAEKIWNKLTRVNFDIYSLWVTSLHHKMTSTFITIS